MATTKRIIGLPKTTATTNPNQSTIAWGTSSLLPTDTATNKLATPKVPSSVANPASLTPWTTVKSFSDNMTKPILEQTSIPAQTTAPLNAKPSAPVPAESMWSQPKPQWEAIGQNADGSMIYSNTPVTPTTPTTPAGQTAWVATPTTPQYSESLYDPNNYLWSGKTKDQFMTMDVADQTNYINQGVQNVEERQAIMNQVKTYAENKAQQEYATKQQGINTQQQTSQNNIAQIQASQRIQDAQTNLDNLKQNLGFLGTWGRPMKSATAIEWASRLLTQSEQTFQQLKQVEEEYKSLRQSGVEFNANQFEEQMRRLQKDLTDSVDASIIQAMSWFDAESALASIDSPKKLFELQQKYLDMVDTSVEWITNRQVNEMKNLQTRYADYAKQYADDLKQEKEKQAEFTKNKNTLNEAMSKAVGYYVDGNGSPLTTTDGKAIEYKNEADKPIIDWNTWKVAYFNTDANGNQVVEIKQLFTPEMKAPDVKKIGTDANGKDIYGTFNTQTGGYEPIPWMTAPIWGWLWDLRWLAPQFPWQARAKNNNPAGITRNGNFDNPKPWTTAYALQQAGIQYNKGTARPWNEWGNYVTFNTIEDWLAAQRIMMSQTYGNSTVGKMLQSRVWTGEWPNYAKQVAWMAGLDVNTPISQLSDEQLSTLQMAKIKKESPWLAKLLQQQQETSQPIEWNFPLYANYIESGKLPTGIKDWTSNAEAFKKQALEWYITGKEQELNWLWLTIANPQAFASTASNAPKMKAINEALAVVPSFVNTMDQLIALTDKYWSELIPWNAKNQMSMLVKDAQLQAKEIYNLWVLNWPDLSLMESIIANPTDWTAKGQQLFGVSFKKSLENAKQKIMDNAIEKAKSIWLSPITTSNQTSTTDVDSLSSDRQ